MRMQSQTKSILFGLVLIIAGLVIATVLPPLLLPLYLHLMNGRVGQSQIILAVGPFIGLSMALLGVIIGYRAYNR
jgi:hypothetical protein